MCGIIGIVGSQPVAPKILEGLRKLEYRGYDSAGIAVIAAGRLNRRRAPGKIDNLANLLAEIPLDGPVGIGHTRWATHGAPSESNAHPHVVDGIAVVHNGIVENFGALRDRLRAAGHAFETDTDTEVIPHLVAAHVRAGLDPITAAARALTELEGTFALLIMFVQRPDVLVAARRGSPLAIAHGAEACFVGSDAAALAPFADRIQYLDDDDWAVVRPAGGEIRDGTGQLVDRPIRRVARSSEAYGKGAFRHYMEKEIYEQPAVLQKTLDAFGVFDASLRLRPMPFAWQSLPRLHVVACGTASLAGLVGKYWLERYARLPVNFDIASEFRYRDAPLDPREAAIFISQSGETADTLAALRLCKGAGLPTLAIVNVSESSIAREADAVIHTEAGPEIGVASTKAFTTQLATLACLTLSAALARGALDDAALHAALEALARVPDLARQTLACAAAAAEVAEPFAAARDVLFLGRGTHFPLALEGALKLKEITYIHAEGYAAGELKHGPIALVDEATPVVVVAPFDDTFEKTASNVHEVVARGGRVLLITDPPGEAALGDQATWRIVLPSAVPLVAPILEALPLQLLAYHTAVRRGTDVDQPRNLAKSVTVE